jgi:1-phosphofructokinase family hexose kinase
MPMAFERVVTITVNPAIDCVFEVPGLTLGAHQVGRRRSRTPAGKGVNVARVLAGLGHPPVATGFVGAEEVQAFESSLAAVGARSRFLAVRGNTRENVTLIDPDAKTETHVRDAGFAVRGEDVERLARTLSGLSDAGVLVVFSGSLPRGMAPEDLDALVRVCVDRGAAVAVDADGPLLRAVQSNRLWAIKPNREELQALIGGSAESGDELIRAGRSLSDKVENVLVSCGAAGGYLFTRDRACRGRVPLDPKRVISTVGCGDALLAVFIAARLDGHDAAEAYRRALATATAAATDPLPGHVEPDRVTELLAQAAVELL